MRTAKIFAGISAILFAVNAFAQPAVDKSLYSAATIPENLKENANAVVRYTSDDVIFKNPGNMVSKHYDLVTVLNDKAEDDAQLVAFYEKKYNSIGTIWMKVYNADGQLIKKYGRSDMYDGSASNEADLVTDDRFLAVKHTISSYPVTVEVYCESNQSSFVNPPAWSVQQPEKAVQTAVLNVYVNPAMGFRYKTQNFDQAPVTGSQNGLDAYTWQVKDLKTFKPEEGVPTWDVAKKVKYATNQFQFFGFQGDLTSWNSFGKWIQGLNADVNTLPDARAKEIQAMTANCNTDKEKVKVLYEYLQHNTRYVSVQLGIGGMKPFAASFVDQKKYGDCKALSNYMYALLKAVNIPAYYAVVNAGTNGEPADDNFAFNSFNHVILCVPLKNDTTWLECTSNTQPFGKLGTFTENRRALLITETGGKLVNTPKSTINNNTFDAVADIVLDADGGAKAKMEVKTTGQYRRMYLELDAGKTEEKKEYLLNYLGIKQPSAFTIANKGDQNGIKTDAAEMDYDKFSDVSVNDKFFYRPRVFDLWRATFTDEEKRRADYYFEHPMHKSCLTTIELPAGFEVENLPANVDLKFSYGNYAVTYTYDKVKNQVINNTVFNLTSLKIPAAKFTEMKEYMDAIAKAQTKKLVIHRKPS